MFGREMAMNQTCYALKSKSGHDFWTNCAFASLVERLVHAAHGSVFDTITTSTFERASVIENPGAVAAFEDLAGPLFERIGSNTQENQTLAATRDLLLPMLMAGKIRIRDAEKMVAAAA
jgi:type I restriction enzyme S subunit